MRTARNLHCDEVLLITRRREEETESNRGNSKMNMNH